MNIWDALNVNVNRTKTFFVKKKKKCSSREFLLPQLKNTRMVDTSRKHCRVVLRFGKTCEKLRREVLWTDKQKDGAIVHSFDALLGWSQLQGGGLETGRELSENGCIWLELVELAFFGSSASLLAQSPNGQELVGDTAQHCRLVLFQILLATLSTQNQLQCESFFF